MRLSQTEAKTTMQSAANKLSAFFLAIFFLSCLSGCGKVQFDCEHEVLDASKVKRNGIQKRLPCGEALGFAAYLYWVRLIDSAHG
jgi:hypothetical protein